MYEAYESLLKQLTPFYARHAPEKSRDDVQAVAKKCEKPAHARRAQRRAPGA